MSTPAPTNLPRHPTYKSYTIVLVFGVIASLTGVYALVQFARFDVPAIGLFLLGVLSLLGGAFFIALGVSGRQLGAGVQIVNTSYDLINRGRLAEAEALLDAAEREHAGGLVARVSAIQRGLVAMRRGELDRALAHLDRAIDMPFGVFQRAQTKVQAANARGIRAFVRAAKGDRKGAREDIDAVRASPEALPQGLARAALAEAILIERAGDRDVLRAHLAEHHDLLFDVTERRERAIVRAFQRLLEATATSVYRKGAKRDDERDEPALADWVAEIVPSAASFVEAGQRPTTTAEMPSANASDDAKKVVASARKQAEKQATKGKLGRGPKVLMLWAALLGLSAAVWELIQPSQVEEFDAYDENVSIVQSDPTLLVGGLFIGVLGLAIAQRVRLTLAARRASRELFSALNQIAKGDLDGGAALLERLTKNRFALIASQAHLALAGLAERRSDLDKALEHCDRGLGLLSTSALRAAAADILIPELTTERAFVLAAMDRHAEAEAELATLPPTYPFKSRALFRVRLLSFARRGTEGLEDAAVLVAKAGLDLPLSARDELFADIVRAAMNPETAGAGELPRIKRELRTFPELRRWMETVAPRALAALDRTAEDIPLASTHDEDEEASAEEEALAEAEAARAEAATALS